MPGPSSQPNPDAADPSTTPTRPGAIPDPSLELADLLDGYAAALDAGRQPDREQLIAGHPHLAEALREALAGLEFIHRNTAHPERAPVQLGDFKILREVGRGGMGVVYEAEQISLKRRVALKVLRFGPVADVTAMQRFQREAETIGHLHHTNIVPIHAIGAEEDVRYYAMQFIEGRDLAQLARGAREAARLPAPREVAGWGLQAAEALAHAHQRGVIHRDIKPSNLILDDEGRIWLTDFGLARRLDDVSLSLSGALLGTPRYMSPEQAAAANQPVDHRTDIYSLGATLYELVTGRPIFDAASPHQVLAQILHEEPTPPRRLVPTLPRDFETILLQCLAKDPARRYPSALKLAEDLRAFREGRPIAARRASRTERASRWIRQHRRLVAVAAGSATLALGLLAAGILGTRALRGLREGQFHLSASQPNLLAEILDARGEIVVPHFPLPQAAPRALPAGSYQVRLSAPGLPSESWPLDIHARDIVQPSVGLPAPWLWTPQTLGPAFWGNVETVTLRHHADLLVVVPPELDGAQPASATRLRLIDGADGKPVWPRDLALDEPALPRGGNLEEWRRLFGRWAIAPAFADTGIPDRTADLDHDGVGDVVLVSRTSPSLLAVSGASGRVLWWHRGHPALPPTVATGGRWTAASGLGSVVGTPASADVDGDGVADFVACFRSAFEQYTAPDGSVRRDDGQSWIGAVSGKDGSLLWQQVLDEPWSNYSASSTDAERFGPLTRPRLLEVSGARHVVLPVHAKLRAWDARTGAPAWGPLDLGFDLTAMPPIVTPADGGAPLALAVHARQETRTTFELAAVELPSGRIAWRRVTHVIPNHLARSLEAGYRHLVIPADLSGPGPTDVLVLGETATDDLDATLDLSRVELRTGEVRWTRSLQPRTRAAPPTEFTHVIVAPDLNDDGTREIMVTFPEYDDVHRRPGIAVIALSGADGTPSWRHHYPNVGGARGLVGWNADTRGARRLVIPTSRFEGGRESTLVLDSEGGELRHILLDVGTVRVADLDGDGLEDLLHPLPEGNQSLWTAVRGLAPVPWRAHDVWQPVASGDSGQHADFVGFENHELVLRSGTNRAVRWRAREEFSNPATVHAPFFGSHLHGTNAGTAIFVTVNRWRTVSPTERTSYRTLAAFDRSTGRRLWTADPFELGNGSTSGSTMGWAFDYPSEDFADLDGDGQPDVLSAVTLEGERRRLSVVSGRDGRLLWSTPIVDGAVALDPRPAGMPVADFNHDDALDLALFLPRTTNAGPAAAVRATVLDGLTGRSLWREPVPVARETLHLGWPEPTLGDLDGDGAPEVAVLRHRGFEEAFDAYHVELLALDGRDGRLRWSWAWNTGSPDLWPTLFLRRPGASSSLLALGVREKEIFAVVVLDAAGRVVLRREIRTRPQALRFGNSVWRAADLDGDGSSELIYQDDDELRVAGGPNLELRWRWKLAPGSENTRVFVGREEADTRGRTRLLVVWHGHDVVGLDGATGQPRWRVRAPGEPVWQLPGQAQLQELRLAHQPGIPAWLFPAAFGSGPTVVHGALPTAADGRYRSLPPARPDRRFPGTRP